jgi:prevent-host-death family protein
MYDTLTASKMLKSFVPISRFNKGEAGKIIEEVKRDGIKVIVKNNAPECVMITVEDYDRLVEESKRVVNPPQTPEQEKRRKEFIARIRQNVTPPTPPTRSRKEVMDAIGSIDIDEDAVNELRRVSMI